MAFIQYQKCLSDPKQFFKLMIVLGCLCVTIYQLSQCISKLAYPPISTHYGFNVNKTIWYPDVTICRNPPYKTELFSKYNVHGSDITKNQFLENFPFETTSIKEFLNDVTYNHSDLFLFYSYKKEALDGTKALDEFEFLDVKETFLIRKGRCYTLSPKAPVDEFSSASGYVMFLLAGELNFDVYLHSHNEFIFGDEYEQMNFIEQLFLAPADDLDVNLQVEDFSKLPTSSSICNTDPSYTKSKCQQFCVHNLIAKDLNCTLPWLTQIEGEFSQCKDADSAHKLIEYLTKEYLRENCYCPLSCNITLYHTSIRSRKEAPGWIPRMSLLSVYMTSNTVKYVTEVISYDWNTFLSEIGGSLGFLLGLSVIGIIAVFEQLINGIFKNQKKEVILENKRESVISSEFDNKVLTDFNHLEANQDSNIQRF